MLCYNAIASCKLDIANQYQFCSQKLIDEIYGICNYMYVLKFYNSKNYLCHYGDQSFAVKLQNDIEE